LVFGHLQHAGQLSEAGVRILSPDPDGVLLEAGECLVAARVAEDGLGDPNVPAGRTGGAGRVSRVESVHADPAGVAASSGGFQAYASLL
jgi:hypothetical protein